MSNDEKPKVSTSRDDSLARRFFSRNPLHWVGAAAAFGAVAAIGGGLVGGLGLVNLSAIPPHPDGWAHLLHFGMTRSLAHHADQKPSEEPLDSQAMISRGATEYSMSCENCHGAPGYGQSPVPLSMRPEPPMILDATKSLSDKELFFVIQNGVRYTGMPAWPVESRPDEVWALVSFLKTTPTMTRETYQQLAHGDANERGHIMEINTSKLSASEQNVFSALSPFAPSNAERPYLPGDPQSAFPSPASTVAPRATFGNESTAPDLMSACASCHGPDGAGRRGDAFPNLTLQSPQYLYNALKAFSSGQRQSGIMWPVASSLSDDQLKTLAVRIGGAPAVLSHDSTLSDQTQAAARDRGGDIVAKGIDANADAGANAQQAAKPTPGTAPSNPSAPASVERCSSCHLPGAYLGKVIPRIEGQNAAYLRMQLLLFRAGGRGDSGPYDPMSADSHNMSDADIAAVSAYYAAQPPLPKN